MYKHFEKFEYLISSKTYSFLSFSLTYSMSVVNRSTSVPASDEVVGSLAAVSVIRFLSNCVKVHHDTLRYLGLYRSMSYED